MKDTAVFKLLLQHVRKIKVRIIVHFSFMTRISIHCKHTELLGLKNFFSTSSFQYEYSIFFNQ